jgi:hypothetical protein
MRTGTGFFLSLVFWITICLLFLAVRVACETAGDLGWEKLLGIFFIPLLLGIGWCFSPAFLSIWKVLEKGSRLTSRMPLKKTEVSYLDISSVQVPVLLSGVAAVCAAWILFSESVFQKYGWMGPVGLGLGAIFFLSALFELSFWPRIFLETPAQTEKPEPLELYSAPLEGLSDHKLSKAKEFLDSL